MDKRTNEQGVSRSRMPILRQQLIVTNYEPFSTLNQNWTMTNALFVIAGEPSHRHWRLLVSIVTTRGFNCAPHLVSIGHHTTPHDSHYLAWWSPCRVVITIFHIAPSSSKKLPSPTHTVCHTVVTTYIKYSFSTLLLTLTVVADWLIYNFPIPLWMKFPPRHITHKMPLSLLAD